jgi:hypothetical protein
MCGGEPRHSIRYRSGRVGLCSDCLDVLCDRDPRTLRTADVWVYYECRAARARSRAHDMLERTNQRAALAAVRQGGLFDAQGD